MRVYTFFIFLFPSIALAAPSSDLEKKVNHHNSKITGVETSVAKTLNQTGGFHFLPLEKRDEIDDWNDAHEENRIANWYLCPHSRILYTVFNAMAVWQAFQRGVWYNAHTNEDRPRWSGLEHPHTIWLLDYRAQRVDLGRADGHLLVFPLSPNALGEWPGLPGTPVTGPPGDHRVVFDDHGIFAGVATLYTDDPDGTRLIWCYPIHDNGAREVGATAEGNSGVDEAWMDEYDGLHYLYGPDPMGGSHPPP
nr:C052A protein [Hypoxylon sp. CO27-5]QZS37346.1 C052A protein [Hypoxylon sp. CO27-5]